ncbi:hypothetical protein PR003_g23304 [Phytophthora rubi]|uniref:Uncharacterized protein n=1 Tax=Phytophthora rubi TaxID=129364 RepID=A0A6A3HPH6_9STRA|nr:hypothetical protein PR002_g31563 [Phytophthora rubi]KAE8971551.1 hypothetical protein PR001_g26852 [Phytophthora rubi]KAE9298178.1 hypothetical protein PR003_g23304 [Phytophthora rubi]
MASIYCACFAAAASARHSSSRLRSFSIAIPSFSPNASILQTMTDHSTLPNR